jgi:hypothetical protein
MITFRLKAGFGVIKKAVAGAGYGPGVADKVGVFVELGVGVFVKVIVGVLVLVGVGVAASALVVSESKPTWHIISRIMQVER